MHELRVPDTEAPLTLPGDLRELASLIEQVDAKLVIIDPIVASIDVALDSHKDRDVRVVLAD